MINEFDVRNILTNQIIRSDVSALASDEPFSDCTVDSLDHLTLLLTLQDEYGVSIPDDKIGDLKSINDIVAYANENRMLPTS